MTNKAETCRKIENFAYTMRKNIIEISYTSNTSTHVGGALSMTDLMATLYAHVLKIFPDNPHHKDRDRFILSKGHGVLGYFPALLSAGIISNDVFNTFQQNGSDLIAHPVMNMDLGIESSNGSLGQGLSMAVGIAEAAKRQGKSYKTYTLIGDGEANEGSIWEATMLAAHLKLDNLTMLVDYNRMQNDGAAKDILLVENLAERFDVFGWHVIEVDGHNVKEILEAFEAPHSHQKPKAIVANTLKGKGVEFMEGQKDWHHNRITQKTYELAMDDLKRAYPNGENYNGD